MELEPPLFPVSVHVEAKIAKNNPSNPSPNRGFFKSSLSEFLEFSGNVYRPLSFVRSYSGFDESYVEYLRFFEEAKL